MGFGYFLPNKSLYTNLLSMSGVLGNICWISIILSQIKMRRELNKRGYTNESIKAKTILYPYLQYFGVLVMLSSIFFTLFQLFQRCLAINIL